VWPETIVQTCIIHLRCGRFNYVARQDWDALKRDLRPIYQAVNAVAAAEALDQLEETW